MTSFENLKERTSGIAATLPRPVRLVGAVASPVIVFVLLLIGIRIERPSLFFAFLVVTALVMWVLSKTGVSEQFRNFGQEWRKSSALIAVIVVLAFPLTQLNDPVWIRVAVLGAIFAALALGLNIVVGRAGLLDLGYAAFFGIGAYSAALLSQCNRCPINKPLPWLVALLASGLIGALFGVLLGFPVLRLRGDYLAIVTLGFGEIVRTSLNNLDVVPLLGINLTNGPNGLYGVHHPKLGSLDLSAPLTLFGIEVPNIIYYYYVEVLLTLFIVFVVRRMDLSRIGRAWTAMREDEGAAQAMGINTTTTKLLAFASGAFFGGLAGNIVVHLQTGASPESFGFFESITVLAMVVLGGMGNIKGVIVGSVLLIALPEKLRFVQEYRFLIFGLILMLMMRFRPEGLFPEERRRLELEEGLEAETPVAQS